MCSEEELAYRMIGLTFQELFSEWGHTVRQRGIPFDAAAPTVPRSRDLLVSREQKSLPRKLLQQVARHRVQRELRPGRHSGDLGCLPANLRSVPLILPGPRPSCQFAVRVSSFVANVTELPKSKVPHVALWTPRKLS